MSASAYSYEALARQRGIGSVRIARALGKEALEED
jgi:hypothetical protein